MLDKTADADHQIHELIAKRWSSRAFAEADIPDETLWRLLEAARWAPSSGNEQPWYFIVAQRKNVGEFGLLLSALDDANHRWAKKAAVLFVAVARMYSSDQTPNRYAYYEVGQAVANLTLQATAEGLAGHQITGFDPVKVRHAFRIPAGFESVTMIAVGRPGDPDDLPITLHEEELQPRSRKPLRDFVFAANWGSSAAPASPER
jgi:nitroreductase